MLSVDQFIPTPLRNDSIEARRRARLIIYAVAIACLSSIVVTVAAAFIGSVQIALLMSLTFLPHCGIYFVLKYTRSTVIAGHAFVWVMLFDIMLRYGEDGGYNVLLTILLPLAAASLINLRGGIIWTVLGMVWAGVIGPAFLLPEDLSPALSISAAIMTLAVGIPSVIIEYTRSQAVREAEASAKRVLQQQKLLRNFAASAFKGIAEISNTGSVLSCHGLGTLLGHEAGQIENANVHDYIHGDNAALFRMKLEATDRQGFRLESRFKHADGYWHWLEVYGVPQDEQDDKENEWLIAARDIQEEQIKREQIAQTDRLESLGILTAGIAHDFNNLLMVISGCAELLPQDTLRQNIQTASAEAATLTANLMALGATPPLISTPIDLVAKLKQLEDMYRSTLAPDIELRMHYPDEPLFVLLPNSQLNQIVLNLITNAAEAISESGFVSITVNQTSLDSIQAGSLRIAAGDFAKIVVTDNGEGFDDVSLHKAFDPFYSTKEKSRGSGLGLTSCYGIVQQAKGAIRIESTLGEGATILVYLPLVHSGSSPSSIT